MTQAGKRPDPTATPLTASFWSKAAEGILELQRCTDCHAAIFYPRRHCPHCWSENIQPFESTGRGTVASIVEVHRAGHPAFQEDTPYYVALIELEEGVRLLSNVSDPDGLPVAIGAAVALAWRRQNDFTLPIFSTSPEKAKEYPHEPRQ